MGWEILWLLMGLMGGVCLWAILMQGKQNIKIKDPDYLDISHLTEEDKECLRYQADWMGDSYEDE